jgi:hypothetical protein
MFEGKTGEGEVEEGNKVKLWIQPLEDGQDHILYVEQGMHGAGWERVGVSVLCVEVKDSILITEHAMLQLDCLGWAWVSWLICFAARIALTITISHDKPQGMLLVPENPIWNAVQIGSQIHYGWISRTRHLSINVKNMSWAYQ